MKKTRLKAITVTAGLICLMFFCILAIFAITNVIKANAFYGRVMGILLIAAGSALSLNAATTILDRPKDKVSNIYRKLAFTIVILTGVLVVLWLIVLFTTNVGLVCKYIGGSKFRFGSSEIYKTAVEAQQAAQDAIDKVKPQLVFIQISIALTVIVAYINLVVTRRFVFKGRMVPIQVAMYLGAFVFYLWILLFFLNGTYDLVKHTNSSDVVDYYKVIFRPRIEAIYNGLGIALMLSGLVVYIIARFASIGSMRRFRNEGLFETEQPSKAIESNEVTTPTNDKDDVKARIQKLNELHDQGLINDEEYEKKKKDIIDSL